MSRSMIRGATAAAIASSVEEAIQAGRLGERLPSIRSLASTLRVSPVTVAAAYRLLRTRGLVVGRGRSGTRLRPSSAPAASAGLAHAAASEALVDLASGNPDPDLLPPLGPALRGISPSHRLYGGTVDLPALTSFAAAEFTADGLPDGPVAVTSGGLDAIERVLREHLRSGDRVLVEDPTFPALLDLLASLDLTPQPVSLDDDGPRPDGFERALASDVRAVVISSRAQNPSGAAITDRRAADLVKLLRRRPQAVLIEVDDASAVSGVGLNTLARDRAHWAVVRSTSKFLGPDLRVAVMSGDAATIARVQRRQSVSVRWVSHLLQELTLMLWSDPSSARGLARAAGVYAERRQSFLDALRSLGIAAHGRSGFNVWIPVREETPTVQLLAGRGWAVRAGERFRLQSPPAIRVTTSALAPAEAAHFAADLAAVLRPRGSAPVRAVRAGSG